MPDLTRALRVLFVEDNADDAYLNMRALREAGIAISTSARVETEVDLVACLSEKEWDVIISDYSMPTFDGPAALATVQRIGLDIPFIVVSGTVGEDVAVEMMRRGAHDYILKGHLTRLGPAVLRELGACDVRRTRAIAEAEMRGIEERNRVLLSHSSDAISIIDADGIIRYATPPVEAITGFSPEELVGKRLAGRLDDAERERIGALLAPMFEEIRQGLSGDTSVTFETTLLHKNGETRHIESTIRNFIHVPTIRGMVATTRDISQRRAMEQERRARLHAELTSKTKSAFLANMSHELRTPLNAIIGFSELLEQGIGGELSKRQSSYVGNVLQAGRHLLRVVNDILDLSKVEAGKLTLEREWTVLADVVHSVIETVSPMAERAQVVIETALPIALPGLYVDPLRLKQILFNLLSNAIKFTKPGGEVRITAAMRARGIELIVSDTGIGISHEDMRLVFQEFERLGNDAAAAEGTGLGLALTKRLVELHGGTIFAMSELGRGTSFTIVLPEVRRPHRQGDTPSLLPRSSNKVLIVDDDPQAQALIAQHVRAAGCEPLFAQGADETMQIAASERPALITLDILMPNIDGWAILECLRQDPSTADVPIVVISVTDDRTRSRSLGALDHLTKPISRDGLHAILAAVGAMKTKEGATS